MCNDQQAPDRRRPGKRARTIVVGASHWHAPLYVPAMPDLHDSVGLSDVCPGLVDDLATPPLSTPGGSEGIVEVGYAVTDSELKRYCSSTSAGGAGFASIKADGSATFTSGAGHTESTGLDVDSDPLYGTFVRRAAHTLDERFCGLQRLSDVEAAMRSWRAYELAKERHDG